MIPENFKTWWEGTAEGQKVIAEAVKDGVTERKALAEEIAELRKALERDLPDHRKAVDTARAKWGKATKALRGAEADLGQAQAVVHNITATADASIARLEHELREGAGTEVRDFLELAGDLWDGKLPQDGERRRWPYIAPDRNGVKMPAQVRLDQIRTIIKRAEALLLVADPEVAERVLVGLRDELADPLSAVA